ncbi:hypothetical protein O181_001446 [Austropuccinia psidii MF-1]|uniref:Uncharacterized protein n=1 Tax=Austropuccinia psidii MF-1 TaxID=1389203 RepID=A0A9Q3BAA0_9BASI|nr:hypothetical protein [Austropuccinia psidii MF-1]
MRTSQPFRPRYPLTPLSPSSNGSKTAIKVFYSLEEGYSTIIFNHLTEDLEERIVLKHSGAYLFPSFQGVPTEGPTYSKELVGTFAKEQEEFTKKIMEESNSPPNKKEEIVIEESKC